MKRRYQLAIGAGIAALGTIGVRYLRGARTIARHVDVYARHWGDRPNVDPDGVIHYVALGDSAAQGVGASSVEASYVSIIAARLREVTGRPVAVTNLSVSGAVSGDVVKDQLPVFRKLRFTPDIVTLDIGGNDVVFSGSNTVESFAANLDAILGELPEGSFVGDVPWFTIPTLGTRAKKMSEVAAKVIKLHRHRLVPLYGETKRLGLMRFHRHTAGDWFHPNDKGYLAWADLFWAELESSGIVEALTPPRP